MTPKGNLFRGLQHPNDASSRERQAAVGHSRQHSWPWDGLGRRCAGSALRRCPFIVMMIPHHRMGVLMASHSEWNTQRPELRQLEEAMVRVQSQEIEQMAQWYRQWYGTSGG